jgi:hypothetical protein
MHEQFDDIARLVASPISKRQTLRLVGGMLAGSLVSLLWPGRVQAVDPRQRAQNALMHLMQDMQDGVGPKGATVEAPCSMVGPKGATVDCKKNPKAKRQCCTPTEVCCGGSWGNGCCSEGEYCPEPGGPVTCNKCPTAARRRLRCAGRDCCPSNQMCAYWQGRSGTCITRAQCIMINGDPCNSWCCRPGEYCLSVLPTPTTSSYTFCA